MSIALPEMPFDNHRRRNGCGFLYDLVEKKAPDCDIIRFGEKDMRTGSLCVSILFTMSLRLPTAEQKPVWKGAISREGDVIVVHNPKMPQYGPDAFSLKEDLSIGGRDTTDYVLGEIATISTNRDGAIVVTDLKEKDVKVFGSDGKFVRTIGRAGQGPGEFAAAPTYVHFMNKNEILIVNGLRLSVYKTNGNHVRDIAVSALNLIDAYPDSRGNFVATLVVRDESNPRYEL